ncbi:MAG: amino acid racemase [Acidaminococcaceae bacterium]
MKKLIKNGKKLGVIGGMGSAASAEFLRLLAAKAPATIDQEHPVVYMIADSDLPDRSQAILGQGPSPANQLRQDFTQLIMMGADILAVPCNTAHYFIDRFEEPLTRPLIHIIEETVLAAQKINPEGAWMLSTIGTLQSGLYQEYAKKHDYRLYLPNEQQREEIQQSIYDVKANCLAAAGTLVKKVVLELWAERDLPVMTACTEIPLGYDASGLPPARAVSSLGALADACIRELYTSL